MISDSWFEGISCVLGLYNLGFQAIKIITTGAAGYCKQELQEKLAEDDIPWGDHVASVTTLNEVKMISLVYCEKLDNRNKAKAKKPNFLSYFLATYCVTTQLRIPVKKKQHYTHGKKSSSKFINRCKFVEEYYDVMPASDIVNGNARLLLVVETESSIPRSNRALPLTISEAGITS